jgi:hypothetical protein
MMLAISGTLANARAMWALTPDPTWEKCDVPFRAVLPADLDGRGIACRTVRCDNRLNALENVVGHRAARPEAHCFSASVRRACSECPRPQRP